jgi:glycosyltransferase involved in cell wall biosynthesis
MEPPVPPSRNARCPCGSGRRYKQCHGEIQSSAAPADRYTHVLAPIPSAPPGELTPGVNLIGYASGELGLGETLRMLARAARSDGIPFIVKDSGLSIPTRQEDHSIDSHLSDALVHSLSVFCVNPDLLPALVPLLQQARRANSRIAGYWFWELERIPREWIASIDHIDELWCSTEFVARAMRDATAKPIVKIPPSFDFEIGQTLLRADFALPDAAFLFLFSFDFNSHVARKNPEAAIAAFRSAFPRGRDDVRLIVKSVNGWRHPVRVEALKRTIGDDPRIIAIDGFLSRQQMWGLIGVCDAYLSLHRSEGLGLGLAEAMYLGRPAIATGYSGNLEFMDEANSVLVDYRLIPVRPGDYVAHDEGFAWAEPDLDDAARKLRRIVEDDEWRSTIALAGRNTLRTRFTRAKTGAAIRARLVELGMAPPLLVERAAMAS